jgi:outer membrane protein
MLVNFTKKCVTAAALCMMSAVSFAETKIAVLNVQVAVFQTATAKAKFAKMEKSPDFAATKAKLDGIQTDAKLLTESYKKESSTWTPEKKADAEKKLQGLSQEYEFNAKKLKDAQNEVAQQVMQELGAKVEAAVKQVIDAEKIGLVLNSQAAMHATPEYDITAKVTDLINKAK